MAGKRKKKSKLHDTSMMGWIWVVVGAAFMVAAFILVAL